MGKEYKKTYFTNRNMYNFVKRPFVISDEAVCNIYEISNQIQRAYFVDSTALTKGYPPFIIRISINGRFYLCAP